MARPFRTLRRLVTIAGGVFLLGLMWLAARSPWFVETVYAQSVGFQISRALSSVTSAVPFSLAEIALAGVVAWFLFPFIRTTIRVLRRDRSLASAVFGGVLRVTTATVVILVLFYLLWGLNYARAPLPARLGWTPIETAADQTEGERQINEIATLAGELVDATNAAYRTATGSDDLGRPSDRPADAASLETVFDTAFTRVQQRLGMDATIGTPRGRAKPVLASVLMNYLGLTGFYFPWTGEANYNRLQPAPTLPQAVAHEKAHQRGIAPEDEAGFIGYLASAMSDDAYVRYSGALFAQAQLLNELAGHDLARARELRGRYLPGVRRDIQFIRTFWLGYEGPATRVSETVNDRYLKVQGMKSGIRTYEASRNLIVLFARQNGGRAWPDDKVTKETKITK